MPTRDETAIAVLLEEFKARWQQLLYLESVVNRSISLYASALIVTIAWILGNTRYTSLGEMVRESSNSYLVLALAALNSVFIQGIAFKGYQIQLVALYLYEHPGERLRKLSGESFNEWEEWRRRDSRARDHLRVFYYLSLTLMPFATSASLLVMHWYFLWSGTLWSSASNLLFVAVTGFVLCSLVASVSTTGMVRRWNAVIEKTQQARNPLQGLQESPASAVVASGSPVELSDLEVESRREPRSSP